MKTKMMILTLALSGFWTAVAFAAPADNKVPVAVCQDGKTMYGQSASEHRGACSGHGGVASWADGSEVKSHARKTSYR
jgi:hypothetical protein